MRLRSFVIQNILILVLDRLRQGKMLMIFRHLDKKNIASRALRAIAKYSVAILLVSIIFIGTPPLSKAVA